MRADGADEFLLTTQSSSDQNLRTMDGKYYFTPFQDARGAGAGGAQVMIEVSQLHESTREAAGIASLLN